MAGGRSKPVKTKKNNNSRRRRKESDPSSSIRGNLFVDGGFLSDWQYQSPPSSARGGGGGGGYSRSKGNSRSKSANLESNKPYGNNFGYKYASLNLQEEGLHYESRSVDVDNSEPFILLDSNDTQIVAYVDERPCFKAQDLKFTYDYGTSFVLGESESSHRGLGFHNEDGLVRSPNSVDDSPIQMDEQEGLCIGSLEAEREIVGDERVDCMVGDEMGDELITETLSPKKSSDVGNSPENSGFLSIGGMRLYTQDISYQESDDDVDGESSDGSSETSEHSESGELSGSESDSSEGMYCADSDIDDEVAEDYLEGIGGSENLLNSKWLVKQELVESDDDSSSSSFSETLEKFGGIALQEVSKGYGMMNTPVRKKKAIVSRDDWSSVAVDGLLVKNTRTTSAKKKRNGAQFPCSWPPGTPKSKTSRRYPGEKKKYRKEMMAAKRRERMLSRDVDLRKINLKLEQMVLNGVDMFSFQSMHPRDCSQVRRLAAIYRLRSGCQGSGKKRFVTVTRTQYTGMPSSSDQTRLELLIGTRNDDGDFPVVKGTNIKSLSGNRSRDKKTAKVTGLSMLELDLPSSSKTSKGSVSKRSSQQKREKKSLYADQPVSFVSCGVMQSDTVDTTTNSSDVKDVDKTKNVIGAFEVHTKGFGSKMMAKMGFVEGGGLGKDGQGMAHHIEVIKRPKSLGLGVEFSDTSTSGGNQASQGSTSTRTGSSLGKSQRIRAFEEHTKGSGSKMTAKMGFTSTRTGASLDKSQRIGAFEEHTKGFGSKIMAKMGFVEGMGLGKDSQGMVNPLLPVRRPKARGLGAKG